MRKDLSEGAGLNGELAELPKFVVFGRVFKPYGAQLV
jgi:hypothetical protein